jgi:hypothetical protein
LSVLSAQTLTPDASIDWPSAPSVLTETNYLGQLGGPLALSASIVRDRKYDELPGVSASRFRALGEITPAMKTTTIMFGESRHSINVSDAGAELGVSSADLRRLRAKPHLSDAAIELEGRVASSVCSMAVCSAGIVSTPAACGERSSRWVCLSAPRFVSRSFSRGWIARQPDCIRVLERRGSTAAISTSLSCAVAWMLNDGLVSKAPMTHSIRLVHDA